MATATQYESFTASVGGSPLHGKIADDETIWMLANNGWSPAQSKREKLQDEFDRIRRDLLAGKTVVTKTAVIVPN